VQEGDGKHDYSLRQWSQRGGQETLGSDEIEVVELWGGGFV
jgi:hypothetical protein